MATTCWIENSEFGNFLNFTDDNSGGVITVNTSDQIEIEYDGVPDTSNLTSAINENMAGLIMWRVAEKIFMLDTNTVKIGLARQSIKSQLTLIRKLFQLSNKDINIRQWDY